MNRDEANELIQVAIQKGRSLILADAAKRGIITMEQAREICNYKIESDSRVCYDGVRMDMFQTACNIKIKITEEI